ncbi:hypothetical protein [Alteromonas sp. S015]|uniref:hypothetical protein n=1 Tax=Alteromonas sp. S015 TaxID=3117401 RepID=UPI002FE3106F
MSHSPKSEQKCSSTSNKDIAEYNGQIQTRADVHRSITVKTSVASSINGLDTKAVLQQNGEHT